MEGHEAQSRGVSKGQASRAPSRISTSHASSRLGTQSASSSVSNGSTSPQLRSAHPSHRYHHAACTLPNSPPRPSSRTVKQPSREGSSESVRQTPVSAFLLEKLQKERMAESQKAARASPSLSRTNSDITNPADSGSSNQRSPGKARETERDTSADQAKKGMGLKEMEKTMTGLHKQNFDLKLELYHRRERQTRLEERLEALEAEKTEAVSINERLVEELEKRDKAVEEAVAMIITLETKIESMEQERTMVRQIEQEGYSLPLEYGNQIPTQSKALDVLRPEHDAKALARMPSFLSERTDNTENLRSVYLGTRGSVLSLSQVAEGLYDGDNPAVNSLLSPSFSVLSESSFVSVYGRKDQVSPEEDVHEPGSGVPMMDGEFGKTDDATPRKRGKDDAGDRTLMSGSFPRANSSGHLQPVTSISSGSPLQQIERLDPAYTPRRETPRPISSGRDVSYGSSSTSSRSPSHIRTKQEKREALRRVMTDGSGGASLHDRGLPPTPDTTSSSLLRRFKHSNDALPRRQAASNDDRSQGSWSEVDGSKERLVEPSIRAVPQPKMKTPMKLPSEDLDALISRENPVSLAMQVPRPRSADETTISRRASSWDVGSEVSEADSFQSNLDVWLRMAGKPQRERSGGGRASPDLFGFPTQATSGAWTMNAMFGANGGYSAGANMGQCSDQMHDLVSAQHALFGTSSPPPPPNRQSSINAQIKNVAPATDPAPAHLQAPKESKAATRRPRFHRRNSDDARIRASMKTPTPADFTQPPNGEQKRGHYPPVAGQQSHRAGIVRLLRRSIGGGSSPSTVLDGAPANTAEEPGQTDAEKGNQGGGVSIWAQRSSAFDDDRSGATPPPIARDGRGRRESVPEAEARGHVTYNMDRESQGPAGSGSAEDQGVSTAQQQWGNSSPNTASATGSRRKWLPTFGRSNSLKNKTG